MTRYNKKTELKSLGARVEESFHEKLKFEAIKRDMTQGEFIVELYKGFKSKITNIEIEAIRELEEKYIFDRAQEKLNRAQRMLEANKNQDIQETIADLKKSSKKERVKARKLEAKLIQDKYESIASINESTDEKVEIE